MTGARHDATRYLAPVLRILALYIMLVSVSDDLQLLYMLPMTLGYPNDSLISLLLSNS